MTQQAQNRLAAIHFFSFSFFYLVGSDSDLGMKRHSNNAQDQGWLKVGRRPRDSRLCDYTPFCFFLAQLGRVASSCLSYCGTDSLTSFHFFSFVTYSCKQSKVHEFGIPAACKCVYVFALSSLEFSRGVDSKQNPGMRFIGGVCVLVSLLLSELVREQVF